MRKLESIFDLVYLLTSIHDRRSFHVFWINLLLLSCNVFWGDGFDGWQVKFVSVSEEKLCWYYVVFFQRSNLHFRGFFVGVWCLWGCGSWFCFNHVSFVYLFFYLLVSLIFCWLDFLLISVLFRLHRCFHKLVYPLDQS